MSRGVGRTTAGSSGPLEDTGRTTGYYWDGVRVGRSKDGGPETDTKRWWNRDKSRLFGRQRRKHRTKLTKKEKSFREHKLEWGRPSGVVPGTHLVEDGPVNQSRRAIASDPI